MYRFNPEDIVNWISLAFAVGLILGLIIGNADF